MDNTKINELMGIVAEDVTYLDSIVSDMVREYSQDLDTIMENIQKDVISEECPALNTIEYYFLTLSNHLYFMCERIEKLGLYDSISKSKAQDLYNTKYLEHQASNVGKTGAKKPTVAESQAIAEAAVLYNTTVNTMYNKVYKILNNKVNSAETMVKTLSKIFSHRMQESQLTTEQVGRQILNEGNIY